MQSISYSSCFLGSLAAITVSLECVIVTSMLLIPLFLAISPAAAKKLAKFIMSVIYLVSLTSTLGMPLTSASTEISCIAVPASELGISRLLNTGFLAVHRPA